MKSKTFGIQNKSKWHAIQTASTSTESLPPLHIQKEASVRYSDAGPAGVAREPYPGQVSRGESWRM